MSKIKRISSKKIVDQRVISHYSSVSLINQNQTLMNLKQPAEKPEMFNESPYAQKLTKLRSTSILKDPSFFQSSGLVSPPLNQKFMLNSKSKINLNSSFISKAKDLNENNVKPKKNNLIKRQSMDNENYLLELKIDEICTKHKENGLSHELLEKYKECFDEVIFKDRTFGNVLGKIKSAYDEMIKSKGDCAIENNKLKSEIFEFSRKLTEEIEENKKMHKKIQKFSRENVELGRALEERDSNCRVLQEHLLKITNISIDEVPQDRTSWKVLVAENKSYSEMCGKLEKKIKTLRVQEKKLMKLFWALKQKGYPVEEIYENLSSKKKKMKKQSVQASLEDISDNENINTEPAKNKPKPSNVPSLKMNKVEPNSFSERGSDSNDEEISY